MDDVVDVPTDNSESEHSDDDDVTAVQVLSFIAASHSTHVQACSLILELQDIDDDKLPDHLEGDFSVDCRRPVSDFLEQISSGPASIFYNQSGFTLDEWRVLGFFYFPPHLLINCRNCQLRCAPLSPILPVEQGNSMLNVAALLSLTSSRDYWQQSYCFER